jgi:glucokinase
MRTTNLPWVVDADELESRSGIPTVALLNDLEATGWGVSALEQSQVVVLNPGRPDAAGNGAVIAAGTGLGEGGIYWNGSEARPFACEGGHASFSPTDELGDRLLQFLRHLHGHVSWERVLSGPGLADLFRFMVLEAGESEPDWFLEADHAGDPVPAVSEMALEGRCEISVRTLELFARLYGEEAGNLALKVMATGGVWVGGGIAPRIRRFLEDGAFMDGFLAKGRMRPLLESMPVRIALDDRAALFGAARFAATTQSS